MSVDHPGSPFTIAQAGTYILSEDHLLRVIAVGSSEPLCLDLDHELIIWFTSRYCIDESDGFQNGLLGSRFMNKIERNISMGVTFMNDFKLKKLKANLHHVSTMYKGRILATLLCQICHPPS